MSKSIHDSYPDWDYVEGAVRKKTFGVLATVDGKNRPRSSGILYGVAPPSSPFALYFLTVDSYAKVRNVRANPRVSLTVPFPHRILSFIPAPCVTFTGHADTVPFDDPDARWAFEQQRILRDIVGWMGEEEGSVFLKLTPDPKVLCHGLGIPLMKLRGNHTAGAYRVYVPDGQLAGAR